MTIHLVMFRGKVEGKSFLHQMTQTLARIQSLTHQYYMNMALSQLC